MIHGGAGAIHAPERYDGSLRRIIEAGAQLLETGASALDAVSHCVTLLEDDPLYNAGRGSVLNVDGIVECDASIMDGRTLDARAIAGVRGVRNPVLLARHPGCEPPWRDCVCPAPSSKTSIALLHAAL
jgi:beta-aspartyl-peptidase (threonine type)